MPRECSITSATPCIRLNEVFHDPVKLRGQTFMAAFSSLVGAPYPQQGILLEYKANRSGMVTIVSCGVLFALITGLIVGSVHGLDSGAAYAGAILTLITAIEALVFWIYK